LGLALSEFLIVFPALFAIVNPFALVFIFRSITADRDRPEVLRIADRVGLFSFIVMVAALLGGAFVLALFGISLAALRIAGGLVVALFAWDLLNTPETRQGRKDQQAEAGMEKEDIAFFPLTIPITTGPGTIATAIALSARRPHVGDDRLVAFLLGGVAAALAMGVVVWLACRYADWVSTLLGPSGSRVVTRLSAFLLLCIGVQIMVTGVTEIFGPLLRAHD